FLDEPTAGIDPVARRRLWDLLFDLSGRGVTLFVTTHYMDEAERCSRVAYIYLSKLLVLGDPGSLKRLPQVTPEGTRRLELRSQDPARHLAALRRMDEVADATLFGQDIHLLVAQGVSETRIRDALRVGAEEAPMREIPPSLEDVFVTLTAAAQKDAGAAASASSTQATAPGASALDAAGASPEARRSPSVADAPARRGRPLTGLVAVLTKEFTHVRRQPATLLFMLIVPVFQLLVFGYAINLQIEHIPTVVLDLDRRDQAQRLVESFVNTRTFRIVERVNDEQSLHDALSAGRAKVGVLIPGDYTERLLGHQQATVQVLIDGSDSQIANTARNTASLLGIQASLDVARPFVESKQLAPARGPAGQLAMPVEIRSRVLYNPDLRSANFFVPGLVGIILQLVTLFLTSFAVVRERESGTLEQLFVTPVGRAGFMLGKLAPYAIIGFVESLIVLCVMVYLFQVPIHGDLLLLLALVALFLVCSLGLGLLVSTLARTQATAMQFAFVIMLPSVLLSGFMFPRAEMPLPIYVLTYAIPATYFLEILRGIIQRASTFTDLIPWIVGMTLTTVTVLAVSVARFRKTLS
ncbi:MAG: ABC transporter permease, partial [Phycisphaerales bacterium JB039]